ncbi:MAG TPA: DUF1569 domain-containing protein [Chitinophagales bacterium]|nr:DUF1569 domain-containing protein [Chitinophagales bacterium]
MALPNIFDSAVVQSFIDRINLLTPESRPLWGKMSVDQMLAHLNVTYELVYEEGKHPKPNFLMRGVMRLFIKNYIVGETPYQADIKTAPYFIINGNKDFEKEKSRLIEYVQKTQQLGAEHFEWKESHAFGELNSWEWNNLFYKHLEHHLRQFDV